MFNTLFVRQVFAEVVTPSCSYSLFLLCPDNITAFFHLWKNECLAWGGFCFISINGLKISTVVFSECEDCCLPDHSHCPDIVYWAAEVFGSPS